MESKHKSVSIRVLQSRKVPDICVSMSIPFDCCWCCLNCLKHNDSLDNKIHKNAEMSALAFALFENAREKLIGSPLETMKLKVSQVACSTNEGKFVIVWNTQGALSNLRRTCSAVVSCLAPAKLYAKFAENMRLLGLSPSRGVFNTCAEKMVAGIKKEICFVAIGKISVDKAKVADISKFVAGKVPEPSPLSSEREPLANAPDEDGKECRYPKIKASGVAGFILADYIQSRSGGMAAAFTGSHVIVYNQNWPTRQRVLAQPSYIDDFVQKKYKKLGEFLPEILAYHMATHWQANCHILTKISKGITPAEIKSAIKLAISK